MKILIVEDTEDSRILLEDELHVQGFEVDSAINGKDALKIAQQSPPDLIISDILMPEMDGFEFCRHVKQDEKLRDIPFIFYTATYTDSRDEQLSLSLGASRFVIKPQEPIKLNAIIQEVLSEKFEGNLQTTQEPDIDACDIERLHAETITRKLDKKVNDLERQKEQLQLITDALPDLISEVDENYCYRYVNKAYENWHQIPRDKIIGKTVKDILGNKGFEIIQPHIDRAFNGEQVTYEARMPFKNGVERYILARYMPYKRNNKKCVFALVSDISERKKEEKEKELIQDQLRKSQKMEAIGFLAGGIAHDFNNILTAILGYTELALYKVEKGDNDKLLDNLKEVNHAGERAKRLISQLLSFCRQTKSKKENTNLKKIIDEAINLLRPTTPATIEIITELGDKPSQIYVDPTQLHQVIMNLCINARYAIEGHGSITIRLGNVTQKDVHCDSCHQTNKGDFIVLEINDTGTGIKPEILEHIFEPFFTTKGLGEGTGMGLAMIHGIVHEHDGHIQIESTYGKGTHFKLFFPLTHITEASKAPAKEVIIDQSAIDKDLNLDKSHHIMVVDDEMAIARFLEELLTENGYKVTIFSDSRDALKQFKKQPDNFDLVIADQTMPLMTGLELTESILKLKADMPAILCSGYSDNINEDTISEAGIKAYFQKPVNTNDLLKKLHQLVSQNA